jgi:quercetin dioxygenase-like cupin family protein
MKRSRAGALVGALALSALAALALAQDAKKPEAAASHAGHIVVTPDDVKWSAGPGTIPAGTQMAVIEGDPSKPGLFAMRLKMPAAYKIPPHFHPADEHVTVISGTMNMGMGDTLDTAKAHALPKGSFSVMPAKVHHYAFTREETIVQIHGMGPWGITYVNPADDPRKK